MNTLIGGAIGIAVAGIVIGAVAIPIIKGINTTASGFSATDITVWTYIPTFLLLALLVGAVGVGIYYMK
jgi:hypothetical protein